MKISDEQARLAAKLLRAPATSSVSTATNDVPREVIEAAVEVATHAPDLRNDRVEEARERLEHGELDPRAVAAMMLGRIVGDALR